MSKDKDKKPGKEETSKERRFPGAFSKEEQEKIIGGAFNQCPGMDIRNVIDVISQWADQTRKFGIILDAALEEKVSVGVAASGQLSFAIVDKDCDAAILIKDMMEEFKSRIIQPGNGKH